MYQCQSTGAPATAGAPVLLYKGGKQLVYALSLPHKFCFSINIAQTVQLSA